MSSTVNVLCPNGRRINVKVTANTTVVQIIEEACLKQSFDPTKHDLRHGRTVLDVTSTFRYSGIPNNAKLEMIARDKPRVDISEVTIALQVESGERKQKLFTTDMSLYQVLEAFVPDFNFQIQRQDNLVPVLVYMREEVVGVDALKFFTLKTLGLLSGRAMLRLEFRPVEQSTLDKIAADIQLQQKKMAKYSEQSSHQKQLDQKQIQLQTHISVPRDQQQQKTEPVPTPEHEQQFQQSSSERSEEPMDTAAVPPVLSSHHDMKASTSIPSPSPTTSQVREKHPASVSHMVSYAAPQPIPPPFIEFKFPEETAGQDLYRNVLSEVQPSDYQACDRQLVVFNANEAVSSSSNPEQPIEVSDDFFEVTKEDLQLMIRDLRNQATEGENAPLMTAAMRQARVERAFDKYSFAVIRFHFPDKVVLQATFKPRETVHALEKFVRSHLRDPAMKFHLYCTPPKKVLKDAALTLIQAHLVPMAIVYVGFEHEFDSYVKDETLSTIQDKIAADFIAQKSLPVAEQQEAKKQKQKLDAHGALASLSNAASRTSGSTSAASVSGKVPKWYKGTGK